jgi:hypothetical protein
MTWSQISRSIIDFHFDRVEAFRSHHSHGYTADRTSVTSLIDEATGLFLRSNHTCLVPLGIPGEFTHAAPAERQSAREALDRLRERRSQP